MYFPKGKYYLQQEAYAQDSVQRCLEAVFQEHKCRAQLPVLEVKQGQASGNSCSSIMALKPQHAPSQLKSLFKQQHRPSPWSLNRGEDGAREQQLLQVSI